MKQKTIICIAAAAIALNAAALIECHRDELPAVTLPSMDAPPPTVEERIVTGVCTFGDCPTAMPETSPATEPATEPEPETEPLTVPEPVPLAPEDPEEPVWQGGRTVTCWVTAYCGCAGCNEEYSDEYGALTSTGVYARPNHTIAVDPSVIPYGTRVEINGITYTAEDCGGDVNGYEIDVFFDEHWQTEAWATGYYQVTIY